MGNRGKQTMTTKIDPSETACSQCGKEITEIDDWVVWRHKGYQFCSPECEQQFTEDTGITKFHDSAKIKIKKCNFCGKDVEVPVDVTCQVYCPTECLNKHLKHEKIEKRAWEIYKMDLDLKQNRDMARSSQQDRVSFVIAWHIAEDFYNFAKEKEHQI